MKVLARYRDPLIAEADKAKLGSEGINAFLQDQHTINMNWFYSNALGGIKLMVIEEDYDKAVSVLNITPEGRGYQLAGSNPRQKRVVIITVIMLAVLWLVSWLLG